jgi:hypothetical protein
MDLLENEVVEAIRIAERENVSVDIGEGLPRPKHK